MSTVDRTYIFDTIVSGSTTGCNIVNFGIESIASGSTYDNITYLGYGTEDACKILKVETVSGTSYNAFWSNGVELLNNNWADRAILDYF